MTVIITDNDFFSTKMIDAVTRFVTVWPMSNAEMIGTSVQLPSPLLADLRKIAQAEGRSLSAQVRIFLASAVTRTNTAKRRKSA